MSDQGFRFRVSTDWSFRSTQPRGPFDITTPLAAEGYEKRYGYGLVQRYHALRQAKRDFAAEENDKYFAGLSEDQQTLFRAALYGESGKPGCAQSGIELTGGVSLPEGDDLGQAYGEAIGKLYESSDYEAWEGKVVGCLDNRGVDVEGSDLVLAQRPFLVELLELTGSEYHVTGGRIHFTMSAPALDEAEMARLQKLGEAERAAAKLESSCRAEHRGELLHLMAWASEHILDEYADEIAALHAALTTK